MGPVEKEFNPADYPPEYLTVGVDEPLPSILDRVEDAWVRTPNAVLVIPRGSHAFHSTHDFLALGKLQDSREVRVSIASPDPIITGLARLLGFYVVDPPPGHPVLLDDPTSGAISDDSIEQATAPLPLGTPISADSAPSWVYVPTTLPTPSTTTSTWLNNPGDYIDAASGPRIQQYNPASHRPGVPPPRTRPRQTGQLPAVITDISAPLVAPEDERPPDIATQSGRLKARRSIPEARAYQHNRGIRYGVPLSPARWRRSLLIVGAIIAVLLLGSSVYAYTYLPEGTVQVTPTSQAITNLPVQVTVLTSAGKAPSAGSVRGDAQPGQYINAALITSPVSDEGTRPATGTRQVPRGKAQGMMTFTNRTGNAVTVPAGTQFKASNGVLVQTTQAATIPATNFTAQSFGTASIPVVAAVEGPSGNIGAGQVAGIYAATLNYTNTALQGGSVDTIKVVKQEDIDGLVAELQSKLNGAGAGAVMGALGTGQQIITQTIALVNVHPEIDHKTGEDGDSVHVKLSGDAQAYTFKDTAIQDAVVASVHDYITTTYPDDVNPTLSGDVDFASPSIEKIDKDDAGGISSVTYGTAANCRVAFSLTPRMAANIQELVKGKNVSQAKALILSQTYSSYLKPDSIEARLLWFKIGTLPNDPARINVQPSVTTPSQNTP